jgi:hypothetical protein
LQPPFEVGSQLILKNMRDCAHRDYNTASTVNN